MVLDDRPQVWMDTRSVVKSKFFVVDRPDERKKFAEYYLDRELSVKAHPGSFCVRKRSADVAGGAWDRVPA